MLFQPDKSDFIPSMIKEVEAHESRSDWALTKNIEINNKHKNKYGKLKTILSFWYFKFRIFLDGILMKHKARLSAQTYYASLRFTPPPPLILPPASPPPIGGPAQE